MTTSVPRSHTRPNRTAIRLNADQLDLKPSIFARDVIAQQRWRFVHVHHKNIHVAVVVEVSERTAPARVRCADSASGFLDQFLESPVAQVAKDKTRRPEGIGGPPFLSARIYASPCDQQVRV